MELISPDDAIADVLRDAPKLLSMDAEILMRDLYDTIYGIHNHNKQGQHPFATVMTHESEENTITSNLYASIDIFRERKIKETFGISYLEYLSLPTDMCLALLDGGMKAIQNESNTTNAVLKDLANAAKK